jgi:hypothetical protein
VSAIVADDPSLAGGEFVMPYTTTVTWCRARD